MSCSNCFNGCAPIVSDKCVKYTGIPIPELGIYTGDTLLVVENKITEKILTLMDGSGIIPIIDNADLCLLVKSFLVCPECVEITLNDIISALLKTVCNLDARITTAQNQLNALNADYTLPTSCLTGVTPSSDTHEIVQATINKLCQVATDLANFIAFAQANYVLSSEMDNIIANYLATLPSTGKNYTKMIPFVAYPFYGDIGPDFSTSGVGSGVWEKVYLCNGDNGTPDLRGRTMVGATSMPGITPPMTSAVAPGGANPTYNIKDPQGSNSVVLTEPQLAIHAHGATVTIDDPGHLHTVTGSTHDDGNTGTAFVTASLEPVPGKLIGTQTVAGGSITPTPTGLKGVEEPDPNKRNVSVSIGSAGGNQGHPNVQPSIGTYFIMHIP